MTVVLYWMSISHPSQVARKMLDLKGIEYELVDVLPLNQRIHLRLAGFRGGTVPALKLDGRRIQGSRQIACALDERWREPPLFPADRALRACVEEANRWGEEQLQPIPRRLFRYGIARDPELREWVVRAQRLPIPRLTAQAIRPALEWYVRTVEADGRRATEAGVRADLAALLDHVDRLLDDGTLTLDPPNAATLQIMASVNLMGQFADLAELVDSHACAEPARDLFPHYRAELPPFLRANLIAVRKRLRARACDGTPVSGERPPGWATQPSATLPVGQGRPAASPVASLSAGSVLVPGARVARLRTGRIERIRATLEHRSVGLRVDGRHLVGRVDQHDRHTVRDLNVVAERLGLDVEHAAVADRRACWPVGVGPPRTKVVLMSGDHHIPARVYSPRVVDDPFERGGADGKRLPG